MDSYQKADTSGITCPGCGTSLNVRNPDKAKTVFCNKCKSLVDLGTRSSSQVTRPQNLPKPPKSALKLGLEGTIYGIKYQIVGRIRYKDTKSYWWWDEWLLLSQSGQYLWLQEEDWEFVLMHKFTPTSPFDPGTAGKKVTFDGSCYLEVEDNSVAVMEFFEGELTWKAEIGEETKYLDAWKGEDTLYSVEWTDREIMFFVGKEISATELYKAFNLGTPPPEALEEDDEEESGFQKWTARLLKGTTFKISVIFTILFAISAFLLGFMGQEVKSQGSVTPQADGSFQYGPYLLDKKNGIYKINVKANPGNNHGLYVQYQIVDDEDNSLLMFDSDFWHASGYEDGEHWSESNSNSTFYFVFNGEPGNYFINVECEEGNPESESYVPVTTPPNLKIEVRSGAFDTQILWNLMFVTAIYPGLVLLLWIISQAKESDDDD